MPNARNDAPRLRAGTYTSSGITSAYAITAWALQSDQIVDNQEAVPWAPPRQMLPPEWTRVIQYPDGPAKPDGWLRGIFGPFTLWTFGMMGYFLTTNLPSSVYSAPASLMLYDIDDQPIYLNATIYRPVIGQDMEPAFGGWGNVKIRYDFGAITS